MWCRNIGPDGAENVEVVIEPENDTLTFGSRVPTAKKYQEPNDDPFHLPLPTLEYAHLFEEDTTVVARLRRYTDTLEIIVPDKLVQIARFAMPCDKVGTYDLIVTLHGKNVPKTLTYRIQVEISDAV